MALRRFCIIIEYNFFFLSICKCQFCGFLGDLTRPRSVGRPNCDMQQNFWECYSLFEAEMKTFIRVLEVQLLIFEIRRVRCATKTPRVLFTI